MLVIELNRPDFEYDVNSLVRAFYPGETVVVLTPESTGERRQQTLKEMDECSLTGGEILLMWVELAAEGARVRMEPENAGYGTIEPETPEYGAMERKVTDRDAAAQPDSREYRWEYVPAEDESGDAQRQDQKAGDSGAAKEEKSRYKREFKRFLYGALREFTGKSLPWGSLTGIRPTKIAFGMLEQGVGEQKILDTFTGIYDVSEEKAKLGLDIAKREKEILRNVHYEGGYSLYIGIPFCPTTCLYCSFTSYPIAGYQKMTENYIDCLIKEMRYTAEVYGDKILDSVYIGGGTPTTLGPEQLDRLLTRLKSIFDFGTVQEFTVEAGRADSITREKLEVFLRHGVTRISINPQTMNQKTLDLIGRRASTDQVVEAYKLAREMGFDNINMDLILGLPGELEEDVRHTIDSVTALAPDSLTVHSLAIKRASRMNQWIQENGISMLRNTDATMEIAAEGAKKLGLLPYYLYRQKNMSGNFENVGYAKPGKYGLYNILIMEEVQTIVALGAGSISKKVSSDGRGGTVIERCENVKDVQQYLERIDEMIERKKKLFEG